MKQYFVYILASKKNGTLYIGVTSDLLGRVWQHKNKVVDGFTKKYDVNYLVYYEQTEDCVERFGEREATEKLEAAVENRINREGESRMA